MMFNPQTLELFTNSGKLIKKLNCPFSMDWRDMEASPDNDRARICDKCTTPILDTAKYKDRELWKILVDEPNTCLKVDLNQDNIKIIQLKISFDHETI